MALRFLLIGALFLGLSPKSQAQLHVTPKGWPTPAPEPQIEAKQVLAVLERQRSRLISTPSDRVTFRKEIKQLEENIRLTRRQIREWPTPTPQTNEKKAGELAWKRVVAQLEHQRRLVMRKPKTEDSKIERLTIEAKIHTARRLAQREQDSLPVQLISR